MNKNWIVLVAIGFVASVALVATMSSAAPLTSQGSSVFPEELESLDVRTNVGVTDEEVANGVMWSGGGNRILWNIQEKNPTTALWDKTTFTFSTPYQITAVTARRGGKLIFVAGAYANGDAVVEKWVFPTPTGGYKVTVQPAETPIGQPRGPFAANVTIKGGTYIPHSTRYSQGAGGGLLFPAQPIPQKTELYRGSTYGLFRSIEVDPEGRFLLLLSFDTGFLLSVNVDAPPFTLQTLYSSGTLPHLSEAASVRLLDHWVVNHRFALLSESWGGVLPVGAERTVLFDYDNDGQFDGFQTFSATEWGTSAFADSLEWRNPYRLDN